MKVGDMIDILLKLPEDMEVIFTSKYQGFKTPENPRRLKLIKPENYDCKSEHFDKFYRCDSKCKISSKLIKKGGQIFTGVVFEV